jgi:hypothetical protein
VASRKEAGKRIDVETCNVCMTIGNVLDQYGLYAAEDAAAGRVPDEDERTVCAGRLYWARSSEADGWVEMGDLPEDPNFIFYNRVRSLGLTF